MGKINPRELAISQENIPSQSLGNAKKMLPRILG